MKQGRHKLTRRLVLYFSLTLVLFALLIGVVFAFLFTRYSRQMGEAAMQERAATLAAALPAMQEGQFLPGGGYGSCQPQQNRSHHGGMMGQGRRMGLGQQSQEQGSHHMLKEHEWCRRLYSAEGSQEAVLLHGLGVLAEGSVWLVDAQSRTISSISSDEQAGTDIGKLPEGAEDILARALAGESSVSEAFAPLLGMAAATAAAPVRDAGGNVQGAVLVHRPLAELEAAKFEGFRLLGISVLLGFLLAALLAVLLARRFIDPLYHMQAAAEAFAAGDFTGRTGVRQDDEIGELAESLDALGRRLGEAEQERAGLQAQRQAFLSAISHELRTPLTVLRGTWELLDSGLVTDEKKKKAYRRQITDNLTAVERLVGDLLELTRLRNPGFRIEMAPMDMAEACRDAVGSVQTVAVQRDVRIRTDIAGAIPFRGDFGRLRQLLLIILDNAVKFSPAGSEVLLSAQAEAGRLRVSVADRGCGISPDDLPYIFERFSRKHEGNQQGTGLGLAIAKEIAERHGLALTCESRQGIGTEFCLNGPVLGG